MRIKVHNWKNFIFIGLLCFSSMLMILYTNQGKEQDREFLDDYFLYRKALGYYEQGEFTEASEIYQKLLNQPRYSDSVILNWEMSKTEAQKGNYQEALKYYEKVKSTYPAVMMDEDFVKEYGMILSLLNDPRAEKYLKTVK